MRTIVVSYRKEWDADDIRSIQIPEDDLAVLLLGLTRSEHIITNIDIKGEKENDN